MALINYLKILRDSAERVAYQRAIAELGSLEIRLPLAEAPVTVQTMESDERQPLAA